MDRYGWYREELEDLVLVRECLQPDLRSSHCRAQRPADLVYCVVFTLAHDIAQALTI